MSASNHLHTIRIVFHSASELPVADLIHVSCDPYLRGELLLLTSGSKHNQPGIIWRTPTVHNTRDPSWNSHWIVSGVPSSGFALIIRAYDEDTTGHDDKLGKAVLIVDAEGMKEGVKKRAIKLEKKRGHVRPWLQTYLAAMIPGEKLDKHSTVVVSVEVIGKCKDSECSSPYTVGPNAYSQHFSPLIGSVVNRNKQESKDEDKGSSNGCKLSASTFVANKLQLTGPSPSTLRFRYVGYNRFIDWLFRRSGVTGRILHRGLMRQYHTIYSYDKETKYGVVDDDFEELDVHQSSDTERNNIALAQHFLTLTKHGQDNTLYTYVITLDSQWRFTETGDEFAVDFLSKHMMHSGCAKEVVFAGEFYVRRVSEDGEKGSDDVEEAKEEETDVDPGHYELIIDNDSGTYRPPVSHLPELESWLAAPQRLGALARVSALDAFNDEHQKNKKARKEEAKKDGKGKGKMWGVKRKGSSVSSLSRDADAGSLSSSDVEGVLKGGEGKKGTLGAKVDEKVDAEQEAFGLVSGRDKGKGKQTDGQANDEVAGSG